MNWKKYLKIILILAMLGAIIWLGYWFFTKSPVGQQLTKVVFPPSEKAPPGQTEQEILQAQKLQILTQNSIFDYWVNKKTGDIYYIAKTGEVTKKSKTEETMVNSQTINNLHSVLASPDGTSAVAEFNYPFSTTFSVFNTENNNWKVLPDQTLSVAWSPKSDELLYLSQKSLNRLGVVNQKIQKVLDMTQKDLQLQWISDNRVFLLPTPSIEFPSDLWALDLSKKTIIPASEKENGLTINWSADSNFGLKLSNKNRIPTLKLIDKNGNELTTLSFMTLPSKCLIETNKIFCGVPKTIREGVILPDDYYKKAIYFDDVIYMIDLSTGSSKPILDDNISPIDAEHLELSGSSLLFKNRLDDKLYSLKLE